jgi:hypothetical protein
VPADAEIVTEMLRHSYFCGIVKAGIHEVFVGAGRDSVGRWDDTRSFWLHMLDSDRVLAPRLLPIFLASGAKHIEGRCDCRSLFACSRNLVENWWVELGTLSAEIVLSDRKERFQMDLCDPELLFMEGEIKRGGVSIDLFAGPAIDASCGQDTYYIALSYRPNPFGLGRNSLLREIEGALLGKGCQRINFKFERKGKKGRKLDKFGGPSQGTRA